MPDNDTEFVGCTIHEVILFGKVVEDPQIFSENFAFFQLRTSVGEQAANGQWTDTIIDLPMATTDPAKVDRIAKWVKAGRELHINAYYKSWVTDAGPQHAFFIKTMKLGRKKWEPKQD